MRYFFVKILTMERLQINRKYKSKQIFYKNVYNKESHDYGTDNILFENGHSRKTKRSCR